jgi:hypothetical protein
MVAVKARYRKLRREGSLVVVGVPGTGSVIFRTPRQQNEITVAEWFREPGANQ